MLSRFAIDNPVLTKELRVRMRGARAYWILLGYIGFLAVLVLLRYNSFKLEVLAGGGGGSNSSAVGTELFYWIIIPQVFLVMFITPAITSGTITLEKEQQTIDLLTLTRIPRRSIVVGKLLSAVSFTALLILSSLPLMSICFMLGGVDPWQVASAYMEMMAGSILIGAMGIMWSSVSRTTTHAVMLTYSSLFVFSVLFGVFFTSHVVPRGLANPATATISSLGAVVFGNTLLGKRVPEGTGFVLFALYSGLLMTSLAAIRLELQPERKGYIMRGLFIGMIFSITFAISDVWQRAWYNHVLIGGVTPGVAPIGSLTILATMMMLCVPVFATGDITSSEARTYFADLMCGLMPNRFKLGRLATAMPFLVVAVLSGLAGYGLSAAVLGHASGIARSGALSLGLPGTPPPEPVKIQGAPGDTVTVTRNKVEVIHPGGGATIIDNLPGGRYAVSTTDTNGRTHFETTHVWPKGVPLPPPLPPPPPAPPTGDFAQGAVALLVSVAGFALLCNLMSVAFRVRWVAAVAGYVLLTVVWLVPAVAISAAQSTSSADASINVSYLDPAVCFSQMCDPALFWVDRHLAFGTTPMWLCTTISWAVIGLLSLLTIILFVKRVAKQGEIE